MPLVFNIYGDLLSVNGVTTDAEDYGKPTISVPTTLEFNNLNDTVTQITQPKPYVTQAFEQVLYRFDNPNNYPNTRDDLNTLDQGFIANNDYDGLTESEKAILLAGTYANNNGFTL